MVGIGTHQVITHRCEREYTDLEWEASYGDVARDLVLGVQEYEAEEEGIGYDTRGEDVRYECSVERRIMMNDARAPDADTALIRPCL